MAEKWMVEIAAISRALNMNPHEITANPKMPLNYFRLEDLGPPEDIALHWTSYHLFGALFKKASKHRLAETDTSLTDGQIQNAMLGYWTFLKGVYDDFDFMTAEYEVFLEKMHDNAGPRNSGDRSAAIERRLLNTGYYVGGNASRGAFQAACSAHIAKLKAIGAVLDPETVHMNDIITDLKEKHGTELLQNPKIIQCINTLNDVWKVSYNLKNQRGKRDPELKAASKQVEAAKRNLGCETFRFLHLKLTGQEFTERLGEMQVAAPETLPAVAPAVAQETLPAVAPHPESTMVATMEVTSPRSMRGRSGTRSRSRTASDTDTDTDVRPVAPSRARIRRSVTQRASQ